MYFLCFLDAFASIFGTFLSELNGTKFLLTWYICSHGEKINSLQTHIIEISGCNKFNEANQIRMVIENGFLLL